MSSRYIDLLKDTLLRGVIWGFVGVIYGFLFLMLNEYLRGSMHDGLRIVVATIGASALTALFYGSMRLVVIVANVVFIATLMFIAVTTFQVKLEHLVLLGGALGLITGAIYGWLEIHSHVFRADGKLVAGLFSSILAVPLLLMPVLWFDEVPYPWSVMMLAPVVTLIYVSIAHWFVKRCCNILTPPGDGALVGLGVGASIGMLFMIMAGKFSPELLGLTHLGPFIDRIHANAVDVMLGAGFICFWVGFFRGVLRVRWYDL